MALLTPADTYWPENKLDNAKIASSALIMA